MLSVSSVPKCSGVSKVPTDTHGDGEPTISPIFSIRMVSKKEDFWNPTNLFIRFFFLGRFFLEARPIDRVPPSEENVTFLTSMGFSRDRVMRALHTTGNNVEAATNLLLNDL